MTADENVPKPAPEPGAVELAIATSGMAIIRLRGECDLTTRGVLTAALARAADAPGAVVLVDLSDCTFIDSTVIGAIALSQKSLRAQDRQLELIIPGDRRTLRRIIEMSGLAPFFTIHETRPRV